MLAPLQEFSGRCPETQVMLMPGTGDAHHLPVHPQPPMPAAANVDMLPSPAHLHAGSSAIAVSSSTVLFDLSSATLGHLVRHPLTSPLRALQAAPSPCLCRVSCVAQPAQLKLSACALGPPWSWDVCVLVVTPVHGWRVGGGRAHTGIRRHGGSGRAVTRGLA